ncbi:MAG: trypsin-like peptidase domain-containing protein [Bdellovibrionaceae bacterium]|nr:trypsin-like peptidase domain-containing protein [Pseudobdellovibrionaceae bacterium]
MMLRKRWMGWALATWLLFMPFALADEMPGPANKKLADVIQDVVGSVARVSPLDGDLAGKQSSIGSGLLVDKKGYVLTNIHVIGNATKVRIKFPGKRRVESSEIFRDKRTDIAVIKVKPEAVDGIRVIEISSAEDIRVGTEVFAIGVPYGFEGTVSRGIISGKDRYLKVNPYVNYLQTDAVINPGNSGGPLLCCTDGKCIGVVNAIHSNSGSNIGLGFAISGEQARFVLDQLIKNGKVIRGYLGAAFIELSDEEFDALDIDNGVKVDSLVDGDTPARKAGLKKGDVVLKYQGKPVTSVNMLVQRISSTALNTKVEMVVFRDSEEVSLSVETQEYPEKK